MEQHQNTQSAKEAGADEMNLASFSPRCCYIPRDRETYPLATDRIKQNKAGQLTHVNEAAEAMTHCGEPSPERGASTANNTRGSNKNAHGTNQPEGNFKISS